MEDPWSGRIENGAVHGRGACDAKGQAATLYLVLRALDDLGVRPRGDVLAHLVVEEEMGGNGTLAMVRRGEKADACIVLEPSDGCLYTSVRGAVWFRLVFRGQAGHSGQAGRTRSALLMARDAIGVLEKYHDELLNASRGFELFDPHADPMPITFGRLQAGNWPSSAPSEAVLEGVLGLLPNRTTEEVCEEMRQALAAEDGKIPAGAFDLHFMYRHDSSVAAPDHELPRGLLAAAKAAKAPLRIAGMTASCDAWFYNNLLRIPTVVYGPGSLKVAHSREERIGLEEMAASAEVLLRHVLEYCGGKGV
jgi:acetylornithine deacetylase